MSSNLSGNLTVVTLNWGEFGFNLTARGMGRRDVIELTVIDTAFILMTRFTVGSMTFCGRNYANCG